MFFLNMQNIDPFSECLALIKETIDNTYERCCSMLDSAGLLEQTEKRDEMRQKIVSSVLEATTNTTGEFYRLIEEVRFVKECN